MKDIVAWVAGAVAIAVGAVFIWAFFAVAVRAEAVWPAVHSGDSLHRYFDSFTDEGGVKCCGPTDCPEVAAKEDRDGFSFLYGGREYHVKWDKRKPSPDQKFYACFRQDDSIRCFFAPESGS